MKQGVQEKWQKIYVNSTKSDNIQEIITEVGKLQPSIADRKVETTINRVGRQGTLLCKEINISYL